MYIFFLDTDTTTWGVTESIEFSMPVTSPTGPEHSPLNTPLDLPTTGSVQLCLNSYIWSDWEEWGNCRSTCGQGTQQRRRFCVGPTCTCKCVGNSKENRFCYSQTCSGKLSN